MLRRHKKTESERPRTTWLDYGQLLTAKEPNLTTSEQLFGYFYVYSLAKVDDEIKLGYFLNFFPYKVCRIYFSHNGFNGLWIIVKPKLFMAS